MRVSANATPRGFVSLVSACSENCTPAPAFLRILHDEI